MRLFSSGLRIGIFSSLIFLLLIVPLLLTFWPGAPFNEKLYLSNGIELDLKNVLKIIWTFGPSGMAIHITRKLVDLRPWFVTLHDSLSLTILGWLYTCLFYIVLAFLLSWPANL